jgi:hypothetical protein
MSRALWWVPRIGAEEFHVYLTTPDDPVWSDIGEAEALTDKLAREIHVRSDLPARARRGALAHELVHAGLFAAGLDAAARACTERREEALAYGLGSAFAHLIRMPRAPRL